MSAAAGRGPRAKLRQTDAGLGSGRLQHAYRVNPQEVRRTETGQCYAIGSGMAMKLQIAPAPSPAASHDGSSAALTTERRRSTA